MADVSFFKESESEFGWQSAPLILVAREDAIERIPGLYDREYAVYIIDPDTEEYKEQVNTVTLRADEDMEPIKPVELIKIEQEKAEDPYYQLLVEILQQILPD